MGYGKEKSCGDRNDMKKLKKSMPKKTTKASDKKMPRSMKKK